MKNKPGDKEEVKGGVMRMHMNEYDGCTFVCVVWHGVRYLCCYNSFYISIHDRKQERVE